MASLLPLPSLALDDSASRRFAHGSTVELGAGAPPDGRQAVFHGAELLGVGSVRAGVLQPEKVVIEGAG